MSWVRYDGGFDSHPKVTAVIAEDPGAIALHTLANTWSSRTKRPGFVPKHQPGVLLADKRKGAKWAALLVRCNLWHEVEGGYRFHDHEVYRAPARERQTAGTPAELSAKRAAAGRRGGKASGVTRASTAKQSGEANEANGVSKASNTEATGVSPVVSSSSVLRTSELLTPEPVPPTAGVASQRPPNAGDIVAAYVDGAKAAGLPTPGENLRKRVGKQAGALLAQATADPDALFKAAHSMGANGWNDLEVQIQRDAAAAKGINGRPARQVYRNSKDPNHYDDLEPTQ